MRFEFAPAELSGGVVAKLSRNRRLALRFCMYIKALGIVPLPYQGQALEAYAIALQKQYESLRHEFGPETSRAALIAGRAALKERGFAQIAAQFPFSVPPTRKKRRVPNEPTENQLTEPPPPRHRVGDLGDSARASSTIAVESSVTLIIFRLCCTQVALRMTTCTSTPVIFVMDFMSVTILRHRRGDIGGSLNNSSPYRRQLRKPTANEINY